MFKFKQKNVKPKKFSNNKRLAKKHMIKAHEQRLANRIKSRVPYEETYAYKSRLVKVRDIIEEASKGDGAFKWCGKIYFGFQFDGKYRYSPRHTEMWDKDEVTEEMLNLKFPNNAWYIECFDLMFEGM